MGFYDKVKTDKGVINVLNAVGTRSQLNYQANDNYVRIIGLGTQPSDPILSKKYEKYKITGFETDLFSLLDETKITSTDWVTLLTFESGAIVRARKLESGDEVEIYAEKQNVVTLYYSSHVRFSSYKTSGYKCFIVYYGTTTMFISPDVLAQGVTTQKQIITWENLPKDYEPVLVHFVITNKGVGQYIDDKYISWSYAKGQNFVWDYKNRGYDSYTSAGHASWDLLRRTFYGKVNPSFEDFNSTTGGGDGDYMDDSSDTIYLPDLTKLNANSINNTRFFTCYKLTTEQLTKLSQELWSSNFIDIISNSVLKPTDFIVSMNMIPIDVMTTPKMIKAGQWLLNGAIGGVVSGQFFRVDCGSIEIKKKWGGALDYLTKIALFLPFIGEIQLSPDDVMGSEISVIYTVDVMTGSCLASVKIVRDNLDAILYQYNGNCSATYPIVSQDYSALMSGVLQLGIHTVADYSKSLPQLKRNKSNQWVIDNTKISRNENLVSGATSCLFDISPNVQRVGNMSSTVGFMGIKKPFIILSRPIQSLAENYNTYRGFVSNITMTLGDCTGYTEVEEIHLENISATENEISEIENLLKTGVIF